MTKCGCLIGTVKVPEVTVVDGSVVAHERELLSIKELCPEHAQILKGFKKKSLK
jgi:hypothetical protein